jgi:hypothetical protein
MLKIYSSSVVCIFEAALSAKPTYLRIPWNTSVASGASI